MTIREVNRASDPLYWPMLELYVESFPRDERMPLAHIANVAAGDPGMTRGPHHRQHAALAEVDGQCAGFRYVAYDARAGLGAYIFMVVDPAYRQRGIGEQLLAFGRELCERDAAELGGRLDAIMVECERPELGATDADRQWRRDRIAYFQRRGAVLVSPTYHQPALRPDTDRVPLTLLSFPIADRLDWADVVRRFHRYMLGYVPDSPDERETLAGLVATEFRR
ncbi:MAG: GNAT family N-acetyltransferase [Fimbriimonadaceae bacterium]|nr:GNAT family N-acetyltransferase [Fimbriimonadaceae bacterium]